MQIFIANYQYKFLKLLYGTVEDKMLVSFVNENVHLKNYGNMQIL